MSATQERPVIAILGGGSWGTALAVHAARLGHSLRLWVHDPGLAQRMAASRINGKYLPGQVLAAGVTPTQRLDEALAQARIVIVVVPSHHCRQVLEQARGLLEPEACLAIASKGIENGTLMRLSEVARDAAGAHPIASLSGPSFAQEVARGDPTALVAASQDAGLAARLQRLFSGGSLRLYTTDDVIGVELGGGLKNVFAIGAGVVEGLGLGHNTRAALITRGLAEMSRLGEALGARRETLSGLAGLGDLVLTCTGGLSRNRGLGLALGRGAGLAEHLSSTPMVIEGVRTAASARELARRAGVETPIINEVHAVLYENKPPADAIRDLLSRELKRESG